MDRRIFALGGLGALAACTSPVPARSSRSSMCRRRIEYLSGPKNTARTPVANNAANISGREIRTIAAAPIAISPTSTARRI